MKKSELRGLIQSIVSEVRKVRSETNGSHPAAGRNYGSRPIPSRSPTGQDDDEIEDSGYYLNDPKHPSYSERAADKADRKRDWDRDQGAEDSLKEETQVKPNLFSIAFETIFTGPKGTKTLHHKIEKFPGTSEETLKQEVQDWLNSHIGGKSGLSWKVGPNHFQVFSQTKNTNGATKPIVENAKFGISTMKKASEKTDNTQMGYEDKSITSTDKPVEKKEGKKLPVVKKVGKSDKNHFTTKETTPEIKEGRGDKFSDLHDRGINLDDFVDDPKPNYGGAKDKTNTPLWPDEDPNLTVSDESRKLKEMIIKMIRESLDEMAKTAISLDASGIVRGGVPNQFRKPDPKSPTKWSLRGYSKFPDGTPVEAPKNTGANYKKVGSNPNMGRPKAAGSRNSNVPTNGLSVSFIDSDGTETPLEFDFLNSTWPQAKSYIEQEVMATLPDALEPGTKIGIDVYQKIEAAKEAELDGQLTPELSKITLFYDTVSKQLKAK